MRAYSSRLLGGLLVLSALAGTAAGAESVTTTLDTLIAGGSNEGGITLGDKRYFDFRFSPTGDAVVAASAIDVSLTSSEDQDQYQLRFSFVRDPLDAEGINGSQSTDLVIGYRIEVLGDQFINRVGLAFDASVAGGSGFEAASVTETIRTAEGADLSPLFPGQHQVNISVHRDGPDGRPDSDVFSLPVHPVRTLEFEKDILVSSRAGGSRVVITTVDNLVDQVPEPANIALLGAAALLLTRRRAGAQRVCAG